MKLTGKCKEDFEKWFFNYIETEIGDEEDWDDSDAMLKSFYENLFKSMQYGVYVDFFDSVDVFLTDLCYEKPDGDYYYSWEIIGFYGVFYNETTIDNREISRTKAIEKANEIYNKL